MKRLSLRVLATTAFVLSAAPVFAQQTVVWWDFLGGGDGVRMKKLIDDFNKEHDGQIKIDATTLEWGVPFYTKVQTSTAVGDGPDIMTYHESRMPLGISTNVLSPLAPQELTAAGIKASDFGLANWKAAQAPWRRPAAWPRSSASTTTRCARCAPKPRKRASSKR